MKQTPFKKVGVSTAPMYGPRAVLICGYAATEQPALLEVFDAIKAPLIFATRDDGATTLRDLLARPDQPGQGGDFAGLARAIVLSGITEAELHRILAAYRESGLPRPLWATLTPTSENWPLSDLLAELNAERRAMESQKQS
ncbi:MAG: DUF3783 domain-containing protein [Thermodesulfobacteriota bacterium]|nr:DUF3783 domain-containing protein [Thermodesulfobacteriota bacterium]